MDLARLVMRSGAPQLRLRIAASVLLVLGGKARREEQALTQLHSDYALYRSETPAIVPNVPWLDWRN